MASLFGETIKVSIFGESHGAAIGVLVDGLPAGEVVDPEELARFMARRAPGQGAHTTSRKEADAVRVLSGLTAGKTNGAPLAAIIENTNTRSGDYQGLMDTPRPGHADYPAAVKYGGHNDISGGGHFSGRLTAPLCIAGGIALQILARRGIRVGAHIATIHGVQDHAIDPVHPDMDALAAAAGRRLATLSEEAGEAMLAEIAAAAAAGDSVGGIIECVATGLPVGLGDPMMDGVENCIARNVFGIPAIRGIEFGAGFAAAEMTGSTHNDPYYMKDGTVRTATNHAGGVLGGITTGMPLLFRVAVKPTPSIAKEQDSVSLLRGEDAKLSVHGRHDPCIVPRAVPCIEAAAAITLLDLLNKGV
ncbi:MAG: chorismate synthase [Ruminococcaceae bacterium]|nr:chorismate synthase [Oscillospiraceae bacterium]